MSRISPVSSNLNLWLTRCIVCGVVALAVLGVPQNAVAQGTGHIDGVVLGAAGTGFLEGVKVTIEGRPDSVFTDRQGYFSLRTVPVGTYTVVFDFLGAETLTQEAEVTAGQTTTLTVEMSAEGAAVFTGEIVVDAPAKLRALNAERAFVGKKSVIASEKIGRMPYQNAADATSRLPGVYVDDDRGESRFVSIRGANPTFNRVKINGLSIGSPEGNRLSIPLDVFPGKFIDQIEVTKSVLVSQDADSVGGEINLRSPTAFGRGDKSQTFVQLDAGVNSLGGGFRGGASAMHSMTFGSANQWGLNIAANYQNNDQLAETVEASDWDHTDDIPGFEDDEPFIIDDVELRNMDVERERYGAAATLEWKPSLSTRFFTQLSYNNFTEIEYRSRFIQELDDRGDVNTDRPIEVQPPSGSIDDGGFGTVSLVTFEDLERIEREWQNDTTPQVFKIFQVGGEITSGSWFTNFIVGYSDTTELRTRDVLEYRLESGSEVQFDSRMDPMKPELTLIGGPDPYDPSAYWLNLLRLRKNDRYDEITTFQVDTSNYSSIGGNALQTTFGVAVRLREVRDDIGGLEWSAGDDLLYLSNPEFLVPEVNSDMLDGSYNYGPGTNPNTAYDLFDNANDFMEFEAEDSFINEWIDDYTATEDIYSAYGMLEYRVNRWTLLGGVRYEGTKFEMLEYAFIEPIDGDPFFEEVVTKNDYNNWFPGVHIKYDISPQLIARFAWTNTIRRPNYNTMAAGIEIIQEDEEIFRGNPELLPFESMNFDLSLDWYSPTAGVFGVAAFTKDITGFIIGVEEDIVGGEFDGWTESTVINAEDGWIRGIELAWAKRFSFGLGFDINATFARSELNIPDRDDSPLPLEGQTDLSGSFAVSYEIGPFFAQIFTTMVDPFLGEYEEPGNDVWDLRKTRVAFKGIWTFNPTVALSLTGSNLTDQHLLRIFGDRNRLAENEKNGLWGSIGLLLTF